MRYVVQDDPEQGPAAARLIETQCTADAPGRIDHVVLCELVWVLETAYGYAREQVAGVLRQVLAKQSWSSSHPIWRGRLYARTRRDPPTTPIT